MPSAVTPNSSLIDPVRTGLFSEIMNADTSRVGREAAPMVTVEGLSSQYYKLATDLRLDQREGFDPLIPLPADAKAQPLSVDFSLKAVTLARRSLSGFVNTRTAQHFQASGGFALEKPIMDRLASNTLDVHNKLVGDIYTTVGNFGAGNVDPGNFNVVTTDLIGPVNNAIEAVLNKIGQVPTHVVMDLKVAQALTKLDQVTRRPGLDSGNVAGGAFATIAQLVMFFRDFFDLTVLIDRSRYLTSAGTPTPPYGTVLAIVRLADDGSPTFANTFIQNFEIDEDTLAGIYTEVIENPRGYNLIADVAYKSQVEDTNAGYLLTGTLA